MADVIAEEIKVWQAALIQAINEAKTALAIIPLDEEALKDAYDEVLHFKAKLETHRPTNARKNTYEYEKVLPTISDADRIILRVTKKLPTITPTFHPTAPQVVNPARKVPTVEIPIFTGEVTEFANFLAAFELKYDELPIPKREKLLFLRQNVTAGPLAMISSLALTDENFDVALNMLKIKYDNKKDVVAKLYHDLERIPMASNHAASLESTYYTLTGIIAGLKAHGQTIDDNPQLLESVKDKFSFAVLQQITGNREPELTEFMTEAGKYIAMKVKHESRRVDKLGQKPKFPRNGVNSAFAISKDSNVNAKQSHASNKNQRGRQQTKNNNKGDATPQEKPPATQRAVPTCVFCAEQHYSSNCTTHTSLNVRTALVKGRCTVCLRNDHEKAACTITYNCYYCRASNDHNSALCPKQFGASTPALTSNDANAAANNQKTVTFARAQTGAHETLVTNVVNPDTGKKHEIRVLLDNGSNESYITEAAAKRIGLQLSNTRVVPVTVFLKDSPVPIRTSTTTFNVQHDDFTLPVIADTSPTIPQAVQTYDYEGFRELYPQYRNLNYVNQGDGRPIEILIGSDYYHDVTLDKSKITDGVYLQQTRMGWMIVGRQSKHASSRATYYTMRPDIAIQQLCELETLGIRELPLNEIETQERALQQFYANLRFDESQRRYEIRWPWKTEPPNLPTNFGLAAGRLRAVQKHLNDELFHEYNGVIEKQIASGILEELKSDQLSSVKHFLPHHQIVTPEKSTAFRVVFDGSAKTRKSERSINDAIFKGVNLLADGAKIILRWQLHPVVTVSDIEKAFHQLLIAEPDTFYVCLLWLFDWKQPASGKNLRLLRFLRVVFGITASPFLLLAVILFHLRKYVKKYPRTVKKLKKDGFVDNFITGFRTQKEAIEFYNESREIFDACSMNLRKWATNDVELREKFDQPDQSDRISILGLLWNQYDDTFHVKKLTTSEKTTLRSILSESAQFYDPCGLYAPLLLNAKLFLRELHTTYAWDDAVHESHHERWQTIRNDLIEATNRNHPRYFQDIENEKIKFQLHVFSDASKDACACSVYLRATDERNVVHTRLLLAKTKLAKINNIPKLELIGVLMGIHALMYVRDALNVATDDYLWTDSTCVLSWISSTKILPVFIARQVDRINAIENVTKRHVPGLLNPADLPSRGCTITNLPDEWLNGPAWLRNEADWPPDTSPPVHVDIPIELRDKQTYVIVNEQKFPFDLKADHYSSLQKLLRKTTLAMQFTHNIAKDKSPFTRVSFFEAQKLWIKFEQENHYHDVIEALKNRKNHPLITKLNLIEDAQGFIRCAGRFKNAPLTQHERSPLLLPSPKNSPFVRLLVQNFHEELHHAGTEQLLTLIRRHYWIVSARRAIYSLIRACTQCKRYTARPYHQPQTSDLPQFRLEEHSTPFEKIGVDIFGPLISSNEKRWVLLATDLVTRGVDLELLDDMSTDKQLLALRTIFARRTKPKFIVSDNAPQFITLRQVFETQFTHEFEWKLLPVHSPWEGGVYERLVKIAKNAIQKTYHNTAVTDYVLRTVLAEIADTMNNRPLTAVTDHDAINQVQPLTPNHFLRGYYKSTPEINAAANVEIPTPTVNQLITLTRCCENNLDKFWTIWKTHYLQFLREKGYFRNRQFTKQPTLVQPRVGAIVLISEKHVKRNKWKIGKIIDLIVSSDGKVRAAKIKTSNGTLVRPVFELFPLEITDDTVNDDEWDDPIIEVEEVTDDEAA